MPIKLFKKGVKDIYYDMMKRNIIVSYYLMCNVDINNINNITHSIAFAHSKEDVYFLVEDDLRDIKTVENAERYRIVKHVTSDDEAGFYAIFMKNEDFVHTWNSFLSSKR